MTRCWEFAEEIPGQSTSAFSHVAADNNVHLIAGIISLSQLYSSDVFISGSWNCNHNCKSVIMILLFLLTVLYTQK